VVIHPFLNGNGRWSRMLANIYLNITLSEVVSLSCVKRMVWFMVFNATFNNISVILRQSVLLVEETGVSGENTNLS
jgi:fido (protein-threonine AMPylation protein)